MARAPRVDAVDVARGVALLGMMFVHLGPRWTEQNPPVGQMIAGGRAAPLFALLAGVALSLVHRRDPRGTGSVTATCIRGAVLIVLGLVLGSLNGMPVYVILAFYGLLIVMALPFRRLPARTLIALGLVWAVVAPVLLLWLQIEHGPVVSDQAELSDAWPPWNLLAELVVWGEYPAGVWFAYVLVGLGIGRLDLGDLRSSLRVLAGGALLLAGSLAIGAAAIARGVFDDLAVQGWRQLFVLSPYPYAPASWPELWLVGEHTSRPLNVLGAIGSALVVIGLCALATRAPWGRTVLSPLRAAGAMTLTLYTVHVLWTWRLAVHAADSVDPAAQIGSYGDWLLQVVVLGTFAVMWRRWVGRGPLESALRLISLPQTWQWERKNAPDEVRGVSATAERSED
ncbi:DUF418 domain-containing protein [Aeromicrobium wangtongii]|uniref:DUF418 domain-containing protein n=1 Tax=Aeromicrobium wangtongii TaxID=2969247 RepID=UPI002016E783|nr:DUF418 domain-containing protein [Aeromicrobium wangtongii]MCL3818238.1 DUF418 domain-containing protein [Aeromicrobium wangtongii]